MNRREYLATIGVVGGALLAGCPGDTNTPTPTASGAVETDTPIPSETPTPTETEPTETQTPTEEPTETPSEYERRVNGYANDYGDLVQEYAAADSEASTFAEVSPSQGMDDLLEEARDIQNNVETLVRAEPETEAEERAINQIMAVADFFEELLLVHQHLSRTKRSAREAWDEATQGTHDGNRMDQLQSNLGDARNRASELEASSERSDFQVLSPIGLGPSDHDDRITTITDEIAAYNQLATLLDDFAWAESRRTLANTDYDAGDYQEASTAYFDLEETFAELAADFDREWPRSIDPPAGDNRIATEAQCTADGYAAFCSSMDDAAQSGADGNADRQQAAEGRAHDAIDALCADEDVE